MPLPQQPSPPSVPRRARTQRPSLFSRNLFRYQHRRRHTTLDIFSSHQSGQQQPPSDYTYHSSSFLNRHRFRNSSHQSTHHYHPKPIYIYPGLLRIVRDKAIAFDNQCPAVLYKCRECRRDNRSAQQTPAVNSHTSNQHLNAPTLDHHSSTPSASPSPKCSHQVSCPICLEEFHGKDLVRKLPCNVNHIFHSKCILDWFISHHRCPLCNDSVSNTLEASSTTNIANITRMDDNLVGGVPVPSLDHAAGVLVVQSEPSSRRHLRLHRQRAVSYSHPPSAQYVPPQEPPRRQVSSPGEQEDDEGEDEQKGLQKGEEQKLAQGEKTRRKTRGSRTYSYIVHDNVRMELNPFIPV